MKIKTAVDLGEAVRERRKRLKVTQRDLAMVSGTGLRFIVDLEKGKPTCQLEKVLQVTEALGMRLEFMSEEEAGRCDS